MFTSSVTQQNPFVCTLQAKCVNHFLPDKIFAKHLFWESLCLSSVLRSGYDVRIVKSSCSIKKLQ